MPNKFKTPGYWRWCSRRQRREGSCAHRGSAGEADGSEPRAYHGVTGLHRYHAGWRVPQWDKVITDLHPLGYAWCSASLFRPATHRRSALTLLRTANTDPGGIFSFAAIFRPDNPLRLSLATALLCRWSVRGRPSIVPRSRAAANPALMRSRITLRSNSANRGKHMHL